MYFQHSIPGCCSVGHMTGLYPGYIPEITSLSGHFIAVFNQTQKQGFDALCQKHTCVAAVKASGGHAGEPGNPGYHIAICIFRKGKGKTK